MTSVSSSNVISFLRDRLNDLGMGAAPEVRSANTALKQRVAGEENTAISLKMKAGAAGRVTRRVDCADLDAAARDRVSILNEMVDDSAFGRRHSDPLRLHIQLFKEQEIGLVNGRRRAGAFLQLENCADMINMRVGADDLLQRQAVLVQSSKNFLGVVSRIDDDRFTRGFVAENRAVALKHADGKCFDNHLNLTRSAPITFNEPRVAPPRYLKSVLPMICSNPGGSFCFTTSVSCSMTLPASSVNVASS